MKIVFYNETLMSGGIEKCIETLIEYLYLEHEIEIIYTDDKKLDLNIVNILKKHANVHKLDTNQIIKCDICIWCRLYMDYDFLKKYIISNKNFLWVHSQPRVLDNCILDNNQFINDVDKIICVSKTVNNQLLVNKPSIVIHNFLPSNINELSNTKIEEDIFSDNKKLNLVTVSRLSNGKGFDRVYQLVHMLKENNINFEYAIIGKGRAKEQEIINMFEDISEVKFLGYKENPYPYIKKADYLVQLSDFETWGNVITEAKYLNTPVIITSFESAYEQIIDDFNGIIIDLHDIDYTKYLPRITKHLSKYRNNLINFTYHNEIKKWNDVFVEPDKQVEHER